MSSMIGISARPFSVSAYSTRGGTSENVSRSTTPSSSSARSRSDRVRGLMPAGDRSSSQNAEPRDPRAARATGANDQERPLSADDVGGRADRARVILGHHRGG